MKKLYDILARLNKIKICADEMLVTINEAKELCKKAVEINNEIIGEKK